ncbi:hypothetical protein RRG08_005389 [Elysia crispata]|uniref:Uncharacterized protein n=1 Tax=Elysia crispata TaxID=231223 RepID=A0AAE1B2R6_9GAST|nr:hypothetical protein RRG08_005389 [Elysia crispata]
MEISSFRIHFEEKETWICNSDAIHVDLEDQVFMLLLKLFFKILRFKACCFHLTQAWYRADPEKLASPADYYKEQKDSETGRLWLKMFFAMPALQADEVENCFTEVLIAQAPTEEAAEKFCLITSWITTSQPTPSFLHTSGRMQGWEVPLQMPVNLSIAT